MKYWAFPLDARTFKLPLFTVLQKRVDNIYHTWKNRNGNNIQSKDSQKPRLLCSWLSHFLMYVFYITLLRKYVLIGFLNIHLTREENL